MALIKCPECGKNVSSSAKQCVHCGCSFTVCPECNEVFIGKVSVCPKCGYVIEKENSQENFSTKSKKKKFSEYKDDDLKNLFEINKPAVKIFNAEKRKIVSRVLLFIGLIFFAIAFIMILTYEPSDSLKDALMSVIQGKPSMSILNTLSVLSVFGLIFLVLGENYPDISAGIYIILFASWLRKNDIEIIPYLQAHAHERGSENNAKNFNTILTAGYVQSVPNSKNIITFKFIFIIICSILEIIMFQCFINLNLQSFIASKINQTDFTFQFSAHLIIGIIAIVIKFISDIITDGKYIDNAQKWIKQEADLGSLIE